MSKNKKMQESFAVLIKNAPLNSLSEILNYLKVFYNFEKNAEKNVDPLLDYHTKFFTTIKYQNHLFFITKENMIKKKKGFKCIFYDNEYDFENKTIKSKKIEMDISTYNVITYTDLKEEELDGYDIKSELFSAFDFNDYLNERFPSPNLMKHFMIKQKDGLIELMYTVKNFRRKHGENSELNCKITYAIASKNLTFRYYFNGFSFNNQLGNKISHSKVFKEKKTLTNSKQFFKRLAEIESIYLEIMQQGINSQNVIFHNIRLETPLTKEGFNWDTLKSIKLKVMEDLARDKN